MRILPTVFLSLIALPMDRLNNNTFASLDQNNKSNFHSSIQNETTISGFHWVDPDISVQKNKISMAYLTDLEKAVVRELNAVRKDPQYYAKYVKARLKYFNGKRYEVPGKPILLTDEGAAAVEECYEYLMQAKPLDTLRPSKGMSLAARDHIEDQGPTGKTGHTGTDGSSPFDRIERYGQWLQTAGENIDYGNDDAREIVLALLIDDGVPSRGHRKNIFNPDFKVVGVACGYHSQYRAMCVMTLAGGFKRNTDTRLRGLDSEDE